ncbi:amidohydrolase [Arthrobacter castelli]|uniref:amidohydrolase n=1 Tax=Arthrobacter castelli TaxID=271431 RepID=UPI0004161759|nr:amidohydrolase [Arthrobacter castelli]
MRIDAIYTNGRFRTMDPARPAATSIGVHGGRIVGVDEELANVYAHRTVDLNGAPALPGFHDAHYHLSMTGRRLQSLDLGSFSSMGPLLEAVRERAKKVPPDGWLLGAGYDQNILGSHPVADALDRVAGGRPVLLQHVSGHMHVANTAAFERAGYHRREGVPDVDGGYVVRDDDGRAQGLLQEKAMGLIQEAVPGPGLDDVQRNLAAASEQAVAYGLTSLTEPGLGGGQTIGNTAADFHSYQAAVENGALKPRMTLMPSIGAFHYLEGFPDQGWFGLDLGIRTGFGDDRIRVGPVKIFSDGSLIGKSAAMHQCYHGEPDNKGFLQLDAVALMRIIVDAHKAGWTIATHAIGDEAIDHVMDSVEQAQREAPRPGVRHRIEHFAVANAEQVKRAAGLGIVPVPQGRFISAFGDGMIEALGAERVEHCYRMKSLLKAGIELPGSTDSPVADGNPLHSIHDMVNRLTHSGQELAPDERLSARQAVRAYTYGSAYAAGEEHNKGTLSAGKLADFVVLSDDLLEVDPATIRDVTVGATVIGGQSVYDDGALRT